MGIWSSRMIPLFEGFYLGKRRGFPDQNMSYAFSIPTIGGSSGSPILNSRGEVVAAIHSAYRGFENICMATTNHQIHMLHRRVKLKLLKDYKKYKLIIDLINI